MYRKNVQDGYIVSLAKGVTEENSNIDETEYLRIKSVFDNPPEVPDNCGCRLKESLEWETYELPVAEELEE
ncbi:MAG: hypothetical protein SOW80_11630 [Anaerovoracaceae bacterium]|nr:hypothetical protein [Anaerovoracaceae bacterium]